MTEEKTKQKKAGSKLNQPMVLALVIVLIVAVVALAVILVLPPEEGGSGPVPSWTQLSSDMLAAVSRQTTGVIDADVQMDIAMTAEGGFSTTMSMAVEGVIEYDTEAKEAKLLMHVDIPGIGSQETESYIIGDVFYTSMIDPYTGLEGWLKQTSEEDLWSLDIVKKLISSLDESHINSITAADFNGQLAYIVLAKPDISSLLEAALASELALYPDAMADMDEMVQQFADAVESFDIEAVVLQDGSLVQAKADILIDMDEDMMAAAGMQGSVELALNITADVDYDAPVSIQLPAAAAEAVDIDALMAAAELELLNSTDYTDELAYYPAASTDFYIPEA